MQQSVPEISSPNDPRLAIPFVTIYDQKSLGCSFFLFCLLPVLPMMYSIIAKNDQLQIAQYGILLLGALWVITTISNRNYVTKISRTAKPGQATLVDKFIYFDGETTTRTLVYTFNHIDENGETKMYQTRVSAHSSDDFNAPIGSVIHFSSVPMKNRLNSLINHLPFMWIISGLQGFRRKINRWTLATSLILLVFSLLAIWARAVYLATANIWLELSIEQAITPALQIALSSQPLPHLLTVLQTVPALPAIGATALFFIMLSMTPDQE